MTSHPPPGVSYPNYPTFASFINFCNHFVLPVMVVTGIVGNILTFMVFVLSPLKRQSTSVFLAALAFADAGFLLTLGAGWLDNFRFSFLKQEAACALFVYVTYVFSFLSVWFVVCFTTERYLTLFHEDVAARFNHPCKARLVVCSLVVVCGVLYLHACWTTKRVQTADGRQTCTFVADKNVRMALSLADSFLTLLLPFSILIFMNTRILLVIVGFSKRRRKLGQTPTRSSDDGDRWTAVDAGGREGCVSEAEGGVGSGKQWSQDRSVSGCRSSSSWSKAAVHPQEDVQGGTGQGPKIGKKQEVSPTELEGRHDRHDKKFLQPLPTQKRRKTSTRQGKICRLQRKSFKMLLTVATVCLLLNLPSHAIRLQGLLRSFFSPSYVTSEVEHLCQQLFQLLYYCNFMANFIIYNVCAKRFRSAFCALPLLFSKTCVCRTSRKKVNRDVRTLRRSGQELRRSRERQRNSRLVEVNLAELHISNMESFASGFKYQSPPCLLRVSDSK